MPNWKPGHNHITFECNSRHQKDFFEALKDPAHRIILLLGGRKAGKTFVGAAGIPYFLYNRRSKIIKNEGWVIAPTYEHAKTAMKDFERVARWYQQGGCILSKNKSEHTYELAPPTPYILNGTGKGTRKGRTTYPPFILKFKTAIEPNNLRGPGCDFIWIDECAFIEDDGETWDIIQPHVMESGGPIWITTTPNGFNWLHDRIYKPAIDGDHTIQVIRGKTKDNPAIALGYMDQAYKNMSQFMREQEFEAEFKRAEGNVYSMFDERKHVVPQQFNPSTGLDIDGKPLPGEIIGGIDHGFRDPFVYLWILKAGSTYVVLDEYYMGGRPTEYHAGQIKKHILESAVYRRWADPAGAQSRADLERYGIPTFKANNDQKAGIDAVAAALEAGRLFISTNCINLKREIKAYHYKKIGEAPAGGNDHCLDALRYVIKSEQEYTGGAAVNPWFEPNGRDYKMHPGTGSNRLRYDAEGNLDERGFHEWESPWEGPDIPGPSSAPQP